MNHTSFFARAAIVLLTLSVCIFALAAYRTSVLTDRAQMVLECIMSMSEAAPLDVSQANPGYAFEAAADWCDRFVDTGGRGFGAVVLDK